MSIKKCLLCIIILTLCLQCIKASASEKSYKKLSEITEDELVNAALNFASEFTDVKLETKDIIPIYNYDDELIGYSLTYFCDGFPNGYINFDFTNSNFISDFSFDKGNLGTYENLVNSVNKICSDYYAEKKLIKCNYLEYSISLIDSEEKKYYFSNENGVIDQDGFEYKADFFEKTYGKPRVGGTVYLNPGSIFTSSYITGSTLVEGPTMSTKYNSSLSALSQSYIIGLTGRYACAVVALTEIAAQEGILVNGFSSFDDKIFYTFDALWNYTNTYVYDTVGSTSLGSTYDSQLGSGLYVHCIDMGKYNTIYNTSTAPSYDFYKVAITNNASATFSYRIYVYEGLNIVSSGHTVNVVGYCKANYSGTDWEYLIVADGWNGGTVKYINITDIDFIDKYGVRFYIS